MNLNYTCCEETFITMPPYLHHLKIHESNSFCYLKCNICGNSSLNWPAFRKHNYRQHKNENPIELFHTYNVMINSLNFDDELLIDSNPEINEMNNVFEEEDASEEEFTVFENRKMSYAQFLLELTYQHKLSIVLSIV
jgi:hypothetical protein